MDISYEFINPIYCKFIRREKRFFSYFSYNNNIIIAHCVNTGKMTGLLREGSDCILSTKTTGTLLYTWEAIHIEGVWIGVNTFTPNRLVELLLEHQQILCLAKESFQRERLIKNLKYKPDFSNENTIIEVKNVHLVENHIAYFPDCITERGSRQMEALKTLQGQGKRCIVIYILQRNDSAYMAPHPFIDKIYLKKSQEAAAQGVEFLAFNCTITPTHTSINKEITYIYE